MLCLAAHNVTHILFQASGLHLKKIVSHVIKKLYESEGTFSGKRCGCVSMHDVVWDISSAVVRGLSKTNHSFLV